MPYTHHGHYVEHGPLKVKPQLVARCGGPGLCPVCAVDAGGVAAKAQPAPAGQPHQFTSPNPPGTRADPCSVCGHYSMYVLHRQAPVVPKPPGEGWVPFGTHVNDAGALEFGPLDEGGVPQWERKARMVQVREDVYRRYSEAFALLQDLDRCEHGRHAIDHCYGCAEMDDGRPPEAKLMSHGNPHLRPGAVFGYGVRGVRIVPPDPGTVDFFEPGKWYQK